MKHRYLLMKQAVFGIFENNKGMGKNKDTTISVFNSLFEISKTLSYTKNEHLVKFAGMPIFSDCLNFVFQSR